MGNKSMKRGIYELRIGDRVNIGQKNEYSVVTITGLKLQKSSRGMFTIYGETANGNLTLSCQIGTAFEFLGRAEQFGGQYLSI